MLKPPRYELRPVLAWNGGAKTRCHLRSAAEPSASLGGETRRFFRLVDSVLRAAKTGGIVPPLISLERDVQPGVHVVREVPSWGRADPLWNFNWENLPHKAILWLYYGARISRAKPFPH
jgi:hypothetical protein